MQRTIQGFSRLSKEEKINWLAQNYLQHNPQATNILKQYWNEDQQLQQLHDEFIENTLSNFYLPLGIAPNFLINGQYYAIPMVIEESSVVAAASKAAKYWMQRGGFTAKVISTEKIGHVHFECSLPGTELAQFFNTIKAQLFADTASLTEKMEARGGGILNIELKDKTETLPQYFQLHCTFETLDAMGANFINSCLEQFATTLQREFEKAYPGQKLLVIMSILSNYLPDCRVVATVSCPVEDLSDDPAIDPHVFAKKFVEAVKIAQIEPYRAVTHNKGVMNGIDAVIIATGNDFRAIEAGVHAYAAKDGTYKSLTQAKIEDDIYHFSIDVPLALGTVGGLTKLHPLVKVNLEMLGNPDARELMKIVAVAGLAQNFAAIKSLTTTGIQKGHMKMHLMNILNQFNATPTEKTTAVAYFKKNKVSHSAVENLLQDLRK
ncbi:MAG: hydroxymethylglutaryl-CoA reductase, degradative [Cytophagaceae bacterium]|nr:hydroxymethylglutaryl-CoA reductase, degradative [Cytophagaceae bacterium]|tara:strand:+ start:5588 stop:6892 length:1305 start_codon:yes stop_codon:yes gene_type:complete